MFRRIVIQLLSIATVLSCALALSAAPKDKSAQQKIDQAINEHYLATDFDKAEALLLGVIKACDEKCSPEIVAKAWMYVGIVRGSAKGDLKAAENAFRKAIEASEKVQLDDGLTTPEVKSAWDKAHGGGGAAAEDDTEEDSGDEGGDDGGGDEGDDGGGDATGNMECSPDVSELEARRPVPVACQTDEAASKLELVYKEFGSDQWETAAMGRKGETWIGQIPCSATDLQGTLRWYVRAKDADNEVIDNHGSAKNPVSIQVVATTEEAPPSLPDKEPPDKCADAGECPDEMIGTPSCPGTSKDGPRGTKAWGDPCDGSSECESGLYCINGTCESPPSCETNSDCASSKCVEFVCDMTGMDEGGGSSGPAPLWAIGAHFGYDLMFASTTNAACSQAEATSGYVCTQGGVRYPPGPATIANPDGYAILTDAAVANGGLLRGTMRVMLSIERVVWKALALELRGGLAFNGASGGLALPVHIEGRGKWWFGDLASPGIRGYIGIQAGLAQFDGTIVTRIDDATAATAASTAADTCATVTDMSQLPGNVRCGQPGPAGFSLAQQRELGYANTVSAHKRLGLAFGGINLGVKGAITRNIGVLVNANLNFTFPNFGIVIEPTAGVDFSF